MGDELNINGKKPIMVTKRNKRVNKYSKYITIMIIGIFIWFCFLLPKILFSTDIETIKDSVVMIEIYDDNNDLIATGSGVCIFKKNYIVTNFHVIEDASEIEIITNNNERYYVKEILITDEEEDLALLETTASLKPIKIGLTSDISVGDEIKTISSPNGELNTITIGEVTDYDDKFIVISADIYPGSSGGLLLNQYNRVIGITSGVLENYGNYAINIDYVETLESKIK